MQEEAKQIARTFIVESSATTVEESTRIQGKLSVGENRREHFIRRESPKERNGIKTLMGLPFIGRGV